MKGIIFTIKINLTKSGIKLDKKINSIIGQKHLNIKEVKDELNRVFNKVKDDMEYRILIYVFKTKRFEIKLRYPSIKSIIKKYMKVKKIEKGMKVKKDIIDEIIRIKYTDFNTLDENMINKSIIGTFNSMGITIDE